MRRMGPRARWWIAGLPVLGLGIWLLSGGDVAVPPPPGGGAAATGPGTSVASDLPSQPVEPASARVSLDGGWWSKNFSERAEPPLAEGAGTDGGAVLRGRLTVRQRPWLHPAGVAVRLTRSWLDTVLPVVTGNDDDVAPTYDEVVASTDADGRFTLRFGPHRGELFFLIDRGGAWMDFQKVPTVPRPGSEHDLGDVWLDDRGGIAGVVVDRFGEPVEGAVVRAVDDPLLAVDGGFDDLRMARNQGLELFTVPGTVASGPLPDWVVRRDRYLPFPTTKTDRNGQFRLQGLRPGAHDLFVAHEFGQTSLSDVQVAGLRATEVGRVSLGEVPEYHVKFVDEVGKPWAFAEVAVLHREFGFGPPPQRTDAQGRASIRATSPELVSLVFGYPNGGPWVQVAWSMSREPIRVRRPPPVLVSLIDERGAPIAEGSVRFYFVGGAFRPTDRALPAWMQPVEVAPGQYRGLWPRPVVAVGAAPGKAPAMAPLDQPGDLVMTMLPIRSITVRTVDRHGEVVPRASVRIQAHANPELEFPGAQWDLLANDRVLVGNTDELGLLQVPVWDTFLSLQADHPAFGPSPGPKIRPQPGERLDITLRRKARVHGRLLFHRQPATAGFRVRARHLPPPGHTLDGSGWLDEQIAVTGGDGTFGFRGLDAGIWELRPELPALPNAAGAQDPGSHWKSVQVMVAEDQELYTSLEAELDPLTTPQLTGTVRLDGVPLAGALVRLREPEHKTGSDRGRPMRVRRDRRGQIAVESTVTPLPWSHRYTTDASGSFSFGELFPGAEYELRIDVPAQDRLQFLERRIVRANQHPQRPPTPIDIDVRSGSLQLTCAAHGAPFANRMLRLRQVAADGSELARFDVLTSPIGIGEATCLPAGTWTVEPLHGGACRPAEFTVKPGVNAAALVEILPQ